MLWDLGLLAGRRPAGPPTDPLLLASVRSAWRTPTKWLRRWLEKLHGSAISGVLHDKQQEKRAKGCTPCVWTSLGGEGEIAAALPETAFAGDGRPRTRTAVSVSLLRRRARAVRLHAKHQWGFAGSERNVRADLGAGD